MPQEPIVRQSRPMPSGYMFLPKGNVYMTANCRKQTAEAGKVVFAVVDAKEKPLGIRVPQAVYNKVKISHDATAKKRAQAVERNDTKLAAAYHDAIKDQFPKIPKDEVPEIVKRAMEKGSGRVGRTGTLDTAQKAALGVRAHVRHVYTDYHKLLRNGVPRESARRQVEDAIRSKLAEWGQRKNVKHARRKFEPREKKKKKPPSRGQQQQKRGGQAAKNSAQRSEKQQPSGMNQEKQERRQRKDQKRRQREREEAVQRPGFVTTRGMAAAAAKGGAKTGTAAAPIALDDDDSDIEETTSAMLGASLDDDSVSESDTCEWLSDDEDSDLSDDYEYEDLDE